MGLDDVLQILFFVPASLRRPVALGVVVLLALASLLDLYQDFGLWEAIWSPIWLSATACWSIGLVIVVVTERGKLGMGRGILWSAVFLTIAGGTAFCAYELSSYVYNELGFHESRALLKSPRQPDDTKLESWEWKLNAVKDLTQLSVIVDLRQTDLCHFEAFWPTTASPDYTPRITDVTQDAAGSARWRIRNLRKPAELIFHITMRKESGAPSGCRPQISIENAS